MRYHMFARYIEKEVIPWCKDHGVGILAHSVLGKGLCTGKHAATYIFPDDDERSKGEGSRPDLAARPQLNCS